MDQTNAYLYDPKQSLSRTQPRPGPYKITKSWSLRADELRRRQGSRRFVSKNQDHDEEKVTRATSRIADFITELDHAQPALAAAFVQIGPSSDIFPALSRRLSKLLTSKSSRKYVNLRSSSGTNLRRLLQNMVATVLNQPNDADELGTPEEPNISSVSSGASSDLRNFEKRLGEHGIAHVVIAFEDSEAFDGGHLAQLIDILTIWSTKVHFTLVFGIQTSVDNFRATLPASSKHALKSTQLFDLSESQKAHEQRLWRFISEKEPELILDSNVLDSALSASAEHVDAGSEYQISRHAQISQLFANDLTVMFSKTVKAGDIDRQVYTALRYLPTFRSFCESEMNREYVDEKVSAQLAQDLLTDNNTLFQYTRGSIKRLQTDLKTLSDTLLFFQDCHGLLFRKTLSWDRSERKQLLSGKIKAVRSIRTLLDGITLANREQLDQLLEEFEAQKELFEKRDLLQLRDQMTKTKAGSRGSIDSTMKALINQLLDRMSRDLTSRYPIEIFLRDSKISVSAFWPKPRETLENGLGNPEVYLDNRLQVSDGTEAINEQVSRPIHGNPTCMMYQLLQESGALVNVSDWWEAFKALLEDSELEDQHMMALFQRGLAELQFLGLIRPSRRKADHVHRTTWAGIA